MIAVAASSAPAGFRNYTLNGSVLPARVGLNLFKANCEYAPGVVADYGPDLLLAYAESRLRRRRAAEPDTPCPERLQDAAYRRMALAESAGTLFDTLLLRIRNVFDFFSPTLIPRRQATEATSIDCLESGRTIVERSSSAPLLHRVACSTYMARACAAAGLLAAQTFRTQSYDVSSS